MRVRVLMPFFNLPLEIAVAALRAVFSIAPRSLMDKATVTAWSTPGHA